MDRKLINEICKWGWARLVRDILDTGLSSADSSKQNDGRWARVVNGPAIAEEIRVFKEKLIAARELLTVSGHLFQKGPFLMVLKNLQVNTVIVGVDEILGQIREIKKLQKSQLVMKRF
jgi:hypothetical protein